MKTLLGVTLASLLVCHSATAHAATKVSIANNRWLINGQPTNAGSVSEGLLMNVRMVNATFEDSSGKKPDFDAKANADEFIAKIPDYAAHGVNAFTICLAGRHARLRRCGEFSVRRRMVRSGRSIGSGSNTLSARVIATASW